MDGLSSNSFLMMQRSMEFLWSKQSCILDNIANVETPGYQVKYATFEEALKNAVLSSAQNGISSSSIRKAIEETPVVVREAQESVRMDGTVSISQNSPWSWHATVSNCSMYLGPFPATLLRFRPSSAANETGRDLIWRF